jgi:hypothetical protein
VPKNVKSPPPSFTRVMNAGSAKAIVVACARPPLMA